MLTRLTKTIQPFFSDFFNLIFPDECLACNTNLVSGESIICTNCKYNLPYTNYHNEQNNPIEKIFWGRVNIEFATAFLLFTKGGNVQNLLHQLKYKGQQNVGRYLGNNLGVALKQTTWFKADVIIPIPLHKNRIKNRGYNQSTTFAIGLASQLNIPVDDSSIIRNRHTASQTKKNRIQRWENVKDIFTIVNAEALKNKHVLLVDDVLTTGATLESCANTIINKTNCKVSIATIAYAEL